MIHGYSRHMRMGWIVLAAVALACGSESPEPEPKPCGWLGQPRCADGCPGLEAPAANGLGESICTVQCASSISPVCDELGGTCLYAERWWCLGPIADGALDCDGSPDANQGVDYKLRQECESRGGVCVMDRDFDWWCYGAS